MSTETIALGLPPVPRERRSRADIEAAAPVNGEKKVLLATPRGYCAGVDRAVIAVDDVEGFSPSMQDYLDYVRTPTNGYVSTTLRPHKALEYTVKVA